MKKKKRFPMKRKTKAIMGIIVCIVLAAANMALSNYTWTKQAALDDLAEYHATGELDIVTELPELTIKNKPDYNFYLLENESCFCMFSVAHNFWYGWLDGPCLIAEKDDTKALQIRYNSFISAQDTSKEMLRVFGLVRDENISHLEIDIFFATEGADQTLEKLTLRTDSFIEHGENRYFNIDHIYTYNLSKYLMPPFAARAYNEEGDLLYSEEFTLGQSTSMG